jgi:L,D-transpeptidase ErfK/SrfK
MKTNNKFSHFLLFILILFTPTIFAATFTMQPNSDIIGEKKYVTAKKGDTLHTIGRANDIGQLEMQEANPKINPNKAIKEGTQILVPSEYILPPVERVGLVINLAELRVYYYPSDKPNTVMTFPIGIGKQGWHTPIGETTIALKRKNPTWVPPASIRREAAARGQTLPAAIGPGPKNPLGAYAINFGWSGIRLHGTLAPTSIGTRASHGCIRMYPEDIDTLFHTVQIGDKVRVIYEPYKLGVSDGKLFIEAHELFPDNYYKINHETKFDLLEDVVKDYNRPESQNINWFEVKEAIHETTGYPVQIDNPVPGTPGYESLADKKTTAEPIAQPVSQTTIKNQNQGAAQLN